MSIDSTLRRHPSQDGTLKYPLDLSRRSANGAKSDLSRRSANGAKSDLSRRSANGAKSDLSRRSANGAKSERAACPLYTAIAVISGRWKPMIMQRLAAGPMGFGELQRAMPSVRAKVLREQLRQMTADGLVSREQLRPAVLGVRYRVTPYGRTLQPVFNELLRWGTRHLARRGARDGTFVRPPR
jgi:DNA-binding HxlR family transcriptional regulator